MTLRMTLRMTFKTWDFRGLFKEDFEGDLEGDLERDLEGDLERDLERDLEGDMEEDIEGDMEGDLERDLERDLEGDSKGDFRGDLKQDMEWDLLSSSGQVRSRSGLVQVWFSLQPKSRMTCYLSIISSTNIDEQITKMYSQVLQACFILMEESSVTSVPSSTKYNYMFDSVCMSRVRLYVFF